MELAEYTRGNDWYQVVSEAILAVTDYFDFPSSMIAFGESLSTSYLVHLDGVGFFRMRNKQLTLISYYCDAASLALACEDLKADGYVVKSLNYVNKPMDGLKVSSYGREYYVMSGWSIGDTVATLPSRESYRARRAMERGVQNYTICDDMAVDEVMDVFDAWIENAKTRHFMVVQGHYKRYIQRYYTFGDNVKLLGFRRNDNGVLHGIVGYEVFRGQAQLTLAKHRIGDNHFSRYLWLIAMNSMLKDGATKCYCGTTADKLKQELGMQSEKSYKVMMP